MSETKKSGEVSYEIEGVIWKLGRFLKNWKERYIIVSNGELQYYTETDSVRIPTCKPKTVLLLKEFVLQMLPDEDSAERRNTFSLTSLDNKRQYLFSADSAGERLEWMLAMKMHGAKGERIKPSTGRHRQTRLNKLVAELKKEEMRRKMKENLLQQQALLSKPSVIAGPGVVLDTANIAASKQAAQEQSWFQFCYGKYIPFCVRDKFARDPQALQQPERERFQAAVAFVDISGFTKLSEKLAEEYGGGGAELLNKFISLYFKRLIDVIVDYGGDIIKFAGDAMLVVWRNRSRSAAASLTQKHKKLAHLLGATDGEDDSLSVLLLRCLACNLALIRHLNNFVPPGMEAVSSAASAAGSSSVCSVSSDCVE